MGKQRMGEECNKTQGSCTKLPEISAVLETWLLFTGTPVLQVSCGFPKVPQFILSILCGEDWQFHLRAGETSLPLMQDRFPHPLASAADCPPR